MKDREIEKDEEDLSSLLHGSIITALLSERKTVFLYSVIWDYLNQ